MKNNRTYFEEEEGLKLMKELQRIAYLYSRKKEEVADLVQDLFLEAVRIGKNLSEPGFLPWAHGVLRNRAAFIARTEGRRKKREVLFDGNLSEDHCTFNVFPEAFFEALRPSLRIIGRLINCGLNRKEILYLINIPDSAFRQRLTALRREWSSYTDVTGKGPEISSESETTLQRGLIRRSLHRSIRDPKGKDDMDSGGRIIGSYDPDGHLFTIRSVSAHKKEPGGNNMSEK